MKLTTLPKIEKGIPIPKPNRRRSGITDTIRQLKRGESFAISSKAGIQFHNYAARLGIKIATRKVKEGTYRVWRVK